MTLSFQAYIREKLEIVHESVPVHSPPQTAVVLGYISDQPPQRHVTVCKFGTFHVVKSNPKTLYVSYSSLSHTQRNLHLYVEQNYCNPKLDKTLKLLVL